MDFSPFFCFRMAQRFGKEFKLKSKKKIEALFKKGKRFHSPIITLVYLRVRAHDKELAYPQILVSVPKRNFKKAVDRNLLRRRIKEAFRLYLKEDHKLDITSYHWNFALVYKENRIRDFNEIQSVLALLLRKLEEKNS